MPTDPPAPNRPVAEGDIAPDFSLPDPDGRPVTLSALLADAAVVLYFYPKDDSPGCTAEACSFRDAFEDFTEAGATVVGVSDDSGASHRAFAERHRLPFTLLSDADGQVRRRYGVTSSLFGVIRGRVTFVIGQDGVVRRRFSSQTQATRHVREALASLGAIPAG